MTERANSGKGFEQEARDRTLLVVGGYNGANDALTQALLGPGLRILRADKEELAAAVLMGLEIDGVLLAPDVAQATFTELASLLLRSRPPAARLFVLAGGAPRERAADGDVVYLEAWADRASVRARILQTLHGPARGSRR